ncbi:TRAP transporter small permease [Nitratireductor luteus]|uniref:TRAP transporter small permease n=1 Tax=Nitratireductor luteus TaxID=2976980 RepID=UPI00223F018B|nr:TRAP transporter small permease [Nitratireductor luteus]
MIARALDAGLGVCERVFLIAANGLLLVMLAINLANILSRLFLDLGIIWVFPWTGVLFVWMVFLGFFVIYRRGQDISIDILVRKFGPKLQAAFRILVGLIVIGLLVLILYQAPILVPRQVGQIDLVGIQRYWLSVPFFVSCFLIVLQFLLDIIVSARVLALDGRPVEET